MTRIELLLVLGSTLFVMGAVAVLLIEDATRRVVALNIAGGGVFLVMLTLAIRDPDAPPDAVLQALVLTGIVIAVSITAMALVLIRRVDAGEHRDDGQHHDVPHHDGQHHDDEEHGDDGLPGDQPTPPAGNDGGESR